jgi:uncharacterized membrane protein YjgN (DUF898 family)
MKNYLDFNLNPRKFLTYWLLFIVLFIVPYGVLLFEIKEDKPSGMYAVLFFIAVVVLIFIAMVLYYFFIKLTIESLEYKEKGMAFNGSFGEYISKLLLGMFLSVITLGIYSPWFAKKMTDFYARNSSYDSNNFNFLGKGLNLFFIITLTMIVPSVLLGALGAYFGFSKDGFLGSSLYQIVTILISIPYMYLVYKWMVNLDFKDYHFSWETKFLNSCGKIFLELFLTIITIGIYFPMAYIRLYKYFAEKTVALSPENKLRFGYDMEAGKDFLFLWGQTLLCIITLTIYCPWACSKVGKRFIGKTYLVREEIV